MTYDALEDFAGPGGWDEGAKLLGLHFYGVDYDGPACNTARAAGFEREQADVTEHESPDWARGKGHVSSPSCTLFSMAGSGVGRLVLDVLAAGIRAILHGDDPAKVREHVHARIYPTALKQANLANHKRKPDKRWDADRVAAKARLDAKVAALVLEPARRIMELDPEWVALEQVPEVLPLWQVYERELRAKGWSCFAVIVNAADFGVPQTRQRAILGASQSRRLLPPPPTHSEHPQDADLFGATLSGWVTLAEALEPFGWSPDDAIHPARGKGMIERHGERPDHPGSEPAPTVISKARSWVRVNNRTSTTNDYYRRSTDRPSPTVVTAASRWVFERPATTVVGSFKPEVIAAPGYRTQESRQDAPGSVSVSVSEAGILQSFPPDYPWQGSKSKRYEQVGNAIPPLLAAHVLSAVTGIPLRLEVAA